MFHIGTVCFWKGLKQEKRVQKGQFPENPKRKKKNIPELDTNANNK